jgi:hypothetical protein
MTGPGWIAFDWLPELGQLSFFIHGNSGCAALFLLLLVVVVG